MNRGLELVGTNVGALSVGVWARSPAQPYQASPAETVTYGGMRGWRVDSEGHQPPKPEAA